MRTVDPEEWSKKPWKPPGARHFGRQPAHGVETRLRASFWDAMAEYWTHCSALGVKRLSNTSLSYIERVVNVVLLVVVMTVAGGVLGHSVQQVRGQPATQVHLESSQYAIQHIPFPAVAICSANIISRATLDNFTWHLSRVDRNNTYSWSNIRRNLLTFGSLVSMSLPQVDVDFIRLLTAAHTVNITRIMFQLSPPCSSMLQHCSWRGRAVPCSRLFAPRATPLGYCCVFNSRYYPEDIKRAPKYLDMVGQDYGLSVLVRENPDDFTIIRRASMGLEVLLFDGSEYPILEGGGVRTYPVERNASVFMSVRARAQYAASSAAGACPRRASSGPAHARGYAWCLTQCRRRTVAALCACRQHTLPPDPGDNLPICSLAHLACLNKHKEKFVYYYPEGRSEPALEEELQNGQSCECQPDCRRVFYSAATNVARYSYTDRDKIFRNIFSKHQSLVNSSVIRLFFSSEHQYLYAIEANKFWYQTFARISCEWAAIVGVTVVSASELVFHLTVRWLHHYRRRTRIASII